MLEINLKTKAAAQTTQAFNSMCRFGEHLLGATASGLFTIGGYNDHGVQIPARIDSGMLDMGQTGPKRLRFFYFGIDTPGALKLSIFADGVLTQEYEVVGREGVQNIRIPIDHRDAPRYWSWRLENVDGSFFSLYSVKALPIFMHPGSN